MRLKFIIGFLFFSQSCATIVSRLENPVVKHEKKIEKEENQKKTYCSPQEGKIQFISDSPHLESILKLIQKNYPQSQFDFVDKIILSHFIEMNLRPDQSSPTSRLQIAIDYRGKTYFYDFYSQQGKKAYTYIYGLDFILKKFKPQKKLESYLPYLNTIPPNAFIASQTFEDFLIRNQEKIKESPFLAAHYMRGSDLLKKDETIKKIDFNQILKSYRSLTQQTLINSESKLINSNKDDQTVKCNYDMSFYQNSIFLIDKKIPESNLFGIIEKDFSFMSSTSQNLDLFDGSESQPFFLGDSYSRSSAVCLIGDDQNKIWLFSNQSRDPGQHLHHLLKYGLEEQTSVENVDQLIRHSRHQFLSDPLRLIIESQRSDEDQIEGLLKINLPIYHSQSLGNIWAYTRFNDKQHFILDMRNHGILSCH